MTAPTAAVPVIPQVLVDTIVVAEQPEPALELSGTFTGPPPASLTLSGRRQRLFAELTVTPNGWRVRLPLLAARWQDTPRPPASGRYRLEVATRDGEHAATLVSADLPVPRLVPGLFRLAFEAAADAAGVLVVKFSAPLTDRERGPVQQARLEADYRAASYQPQNAVFFESFYGQTASCNPLAIDQALAELRPDIQRYWSVVDASVRVPDGAVALIEGSEAWWRIRGSARLLVVNDWLRKRFRGRAHQTVLQTWHGTMLKRIALNRPKFRPRAALATLRERAKWDILLSENPYSTRIFRSAYAYFGPIWEEGYPRNDVLLHGDAAAARAKLGIADAVTVLLYAPTWRDNRPEHVDHLDVSAFTEALGPGYVTLIRGHSRALRPGRDLHAKNVLDVTSYPDVSELFLAADALITDYSSVMFDYTVTGKPVFFFVPDFDYYRTRLRGFYFDLIGAAPGPVVRTSAELVSLIRDRDTVRADYVEKYRAWQRRFNPRDDGGAAHRVVSRLVKQGIIG